MSDLKRINVNFTDDAYETLVYLAREQSRTMTDVLRNALTVEKWLHDARQDGNRILIERNGKTQEVIFR